MRTKSLPIGAILLALCVAAFGVACDGDDDDGFIVGPGPGPGGGRLTLTVAVPAGAAFYGYDVAATFNPARATPIAPTQDAITAGDFGARTTCVEQLDGNRLRINCISTTPLTGPGNAAAFVFNYSGAAPGLAEFGTTCEFFDANGATVALACTPGISL